MEFRILGPMEVIDGGRAVEIAPPRQRAVLGILLTEPNRVVSVDRIVDLLYRGRPPAQAIGSVQAYVSHLRRLLEPARRHRGPCQVLVSRAPGYVVVVDPQLHDATRFEAMAGSGQAALREGRWSEAVTELHAALGLWRGPALADFADEPFAWAEASRLGEMRTVARECLIEARLALGEHGELVPELESLVAGNPLRERLRAALMLALYRCGRQSEALRVYQECRRTLVEELGIEPAAELRQLEAAVLAQSPSLDWRPPAGQGPPAAVGTAAGQRRRPPAMPEGGLQPTAAADDRLLGGGVLGAGPSTGVRETPLVGRARELGALHDAIARARAGSGGVVLIGGEAGIGKTAIAEHVAPGGAGQENAVWGRAHEDDGAPAFWMWTQVFRDLAAMPQLDEAFSRAGMRPSALAALVPEWAEAGATGPGPLAGAGARFALYQAAASVLVAVSALRPLIVVLDDLQWADPASLKLLEFLAADLHTTSLLVIGTYRDDEVRRSHPMVDTLGVLARLPATVRLSPAPFDAGEIRQYVTAVMGTTPDDEVVEVIRARSDGNPFFVAELVNVLSSEHSLVDPSAVQLSKIPAGVQDVIRRRLSGLPEQTSALLSIAAVIGRDFSLETLEAVSRLDTLETEDALDVAVVTGVVAEAPGAVGRYRFSHSLVRDAVYAAVGGVRRARLHAVVAGAIEQLPERSRHLAELAHHFAMAVPAVGPDKAIDYAVRAAEAAQAVLAYEVAENQLRGALALIGNLAAGPERDRLELHVQNLLASSLTVAGGFAATGAGEAWARARELCLEVGDTREVLMSLGGLAIFFVAQGHLDESAELTAQVLQLGEALDDTPCLINARFGMGFRAWLVGDLQEAVEELHRVVVLCDGDLLAFGDVFPWYDPGVIALAISGIVKWLLGAQSEGHHDLAVAVEAARRSAHPFKLTMILFYDALLNVMAGDAAVVIRRSEEFGALAARYGLPELVSLAGATGGWAKAGTGDVSAGVEELRRSCAGQQAVGVKLLRTFLLGALADSYRRAGLLDDALGTVDEALATAEETGERFYEPELHRLRGDFLAARWPERAGEARACGERAVAVAGRQGAVSLLRRAETAVAGR